MECKMFKGSITALLTPFKNGIVDEETFQSFVEWQVSEGTDALVPCGTTGESPTLDHNEHMRVIELCIEAAGGKVPIIAGAGSNATHESIALASHAQKVGANAILIVTPYYNKPSQEGMFQHFKAIHDSVNLPIIIYNIPGRSVVDMSIETVANLAQLHNIVGIKDASADLTRPMLTRLAVRNNDFCQLSGEDATAVPFLAGGGDGCISVTANIVPKLCHEMHEAWRHRNLDTAMAIQDRLMPLHKALFCETSPGPVKYAAQLIGRANSEVRLPLWEISDKSKKQVEAALNSLGLLQE